MLRCYLPPYYFDPFTDSAKATVGKTAGVLAESKWAHQTILVYIIVFTTTKSQ